MYQPKKRATFSAGFSLELGGHTPFWIKFQKLTLQAAEALLKMHEDSAKLCAANSVESQINSKFSHF